MNPQQLSAFLWLHWRLRINQLRRAGVANAIILAILAAGAVLLSLFLFAGSFLIAMSALSTASPATLLYVWDGVVIALIFTWMIGLCSDLQRSEAVSLDKFLHLPVSVAGAFVLNYLRSLFSFTLLVFVPLMLGLVLGLVVGRGPEMLLLLPPLAALLLMITALSYQFQGWLASLMVNKRRRQTIIVLVTAALILLAQLPNLANILFRRNAGDWRSGAQKLQQESTKHREQLDVPDAGSHFGQTAWWANVLLPPGWLPLGAMGLAQKDAAAAALGTLGMGLIGLVSLRRGYRTTLRLYRGQFTAAKRLPPPPTARKTVPLPAQTVGLLEKKLPWISEQASAITFSSLRSLTRAPEAKLLLLSPVLMLVIFGGMFLRGPVDLPEPWRPVVALGAMAMILVTMTQIFANQFGFDRGGFRVFVLSPASRRDILLGKNLALAPLVFAIAGLVLALIQIMYPVRIDRFLGVLVQLVSFYFLFCLVGNVLSILAPLAVAPGTLRPAHAKTIPVLLHMSLLLVLPPLLSPLLVPLAVEAILAGAGLSSAVPVFLVLSLAEAVAIFFLYLWILKWEGVYLQAREQKILEVVASKAE